MNRKIKLKYIYKISTNKPLTMRQKILGSLLGLGTAFGLSQNLDKKDTAPDVEDIAIEKNKYPQSFNLVDYTIRPGDNIMNISLKLFPGHADKAKKYILKINNLTEESVKKLKIGQIIKIPSSKKEFVDFFDLEENHHLSASDKIKEFIKKIETLHPIPIKVEKNSNIKTVGYGHRLDSQTKIDEYDEIKKLLLESGRENGALTESDPIVLSWLEKDIKEAENKIKFKSLPALTQNQFDALVSFVFNHGKVLDIREDLKSGNVLAAADKIKNHPSINIEGQAGLAGRRAKEAEIFMSN